MLHCICLAWFAFTATCFGTVGSDPNVVAEVPIESDGDSLTVTVSINHEPALLKLEFGTHSLTVDHKFVKCRFLEKPVRIARDFTGLEQHIREIEHPQLLTLAGAPLRSTPSFAMSMEDFRWLSGRRLQGILGLNSFQDYYLDFDWDAQMLRLRSDIPAEFLESVPFFRKPNRTGIFVSAVVSLVPGATQQSATKAEISEQDRLKSDFESPENSIEMELRFESAASSFAAVILSKADFGTLDKAGVLKRFPIHPDDRIQPGPDQRTLQNLNVGSFRDSDLAVDMVNALPRSLLSPSWMLRRRMLIDIKNQRVYFANRKTPLPRSGPRMLSGMDISWRDDWQDGPIFRVVKVLKDSIADQAGVRPDDKIIQFNGRPLEKFRPYELNTAQTIPASSHTLRIRRGTEEFDVKIQIP